MTVDDEYGTGTPTVLVLMATRNGELWVEEQLQSVLRQQGVRLRVRVSDDASTDGTVSLLRRAAKDDPRIELLPAIAPSGSACSNFLRLIRSVDVDRDNGFTHVALCDQDDIWHPDKLSRAVVGMTLHDSDLYSAAVTAQWPSGKTKDLVQNAVPTEADHLFEGAGQGCTFVLSRIFFEQVHAAVVGATNTLSQIYYHDWLIYALARTWNRQWLYDPVPTMLYRQHASNDTGAKSSFTGIGLRMKRLHSGWYRKQVCAVLAACSRANTCHTEEARVEALMKNAQFSAIGRLRWTHFLLRNSRRRPAERLVLSVFAAMGKL